VQLCGAQVGLDRPLFLIAGPCSLESRDLALRVGERLAELAARRGLLVVFKGSFDKANRTRGDSPRGPGMDEGLAILEAVRAQTGLPVLTDVHEVAQVPAVAAVVDVLQTPAFLCRQTDFVQAVAAAGKPVNLKKGQFLAPGDMVHVVDKARAAGNEQLLVCERGASFGYGDLVVDPRSLAWLRATGCPVVFDATHSAQRPGASGGVTGGHRELVPVLARAAVGAGVAGLFIETHPDPDAARSDAATQWPLHRLEPLVEHLQAIDGAVKERALPEA
jgi:2-dehydro-3-deoxyphosphooctonate aldolase (KDO 8-P synthase)